LLAGVSKAKLFHAAENLYYDTLPARPPKTKDGTKKGQTILVLTEFFTTTQPEWRSTNQKINICYGFSTRKEVCCCFEVLCINCVYVFCIAHVYKK
jgi:hypothetical protein